MGTGSSDPNQSNLLLRQEKIVLFQADKASLKIRTVLTFPHGMDGLKLWEAGIILARYVYFRRQEFAGKKVLQLGTGVGIGGLTVAKWTNCQEVTATDYKQKVIENAKKNAEINGLRQVKLSLLDWNKPCAEGQYDIIIGSDIVYFGCPVADLYRVFCKLISKTGVGIIVIPDRKNYAELFLTHVDREVFQVEREELIESRYKESPFINEAEGHSQYPLLRSLAFYLYRLKRKE